ncbi:DUF305 domain-containing protein [Streptosporangium sp. G12]
MAAQMAARGHALAGDARPARTLLDEAEALIRQAAEHADDEPVWMYFYDETWFRLQRGMTELHLADWPKAIDLLTEGLSGLPESYKRDRAWYGSCLAKAHAEAGDAAARDRGADRLADPARPRGARRPRPPDGLRHACLAEMNRLRSARRAAFDRLFPTLMIRHHEGAITMAGERLKGGRGRLMRTLATDIVTGRQIEVGRMKGLPAR